MPRAGSAHEYDVRYFSSEAEVPFCGHATIAAAVAVADRDGPGDLLFHVSAGEVPVATAAAAGLMTASLTSVGTHTTVATAAMVEEALSALAWRQTDLDPELPPHIAYAGAHHLILAAATRARLAALDYDFERLKALMLAADLTTVDLVWRERADLYHARNPFPVGGVYEDPATGAAAAAFGGYLRSLGLISPPARVTIRQGEDMARPSLLTLDIPPGEGGITVSGTAVPIL
jgi:PhzF family phenazine biosynthesis protein